MHMCFYISLEQIKDNKVRHMVNIQENNLALVTGGISETGAKVLGGVLGFILGGIVDIPVCMIMTKELTMIAYGTCTIGFTMAGVNIAKHLWKGSQNLSETSK